MAFVSTTNSSAIIGIGTDLLIQNSQAKLARINVNSLSAEQRATQYGGGRSEEAVVAPWEVPAETQSLNEKVREVRELTNFIDLDDSYLDTVNEDADQQATFVLFKALSDLRTLAEYAADEKTSSSSLARLDAQFQLGLEQVRDYISTVELNNLDLFLGDKEYQAETSTRTGKNPTEYTGSFVSESPDDVLADLTGNEVFTVSIEKDGVKDDIEVDLSEISGDLTLNSIVDHVNAQIESLTALDAQNEVYIKHQSRFNVERNSDTGGYGLKIESTLTEEVSLSAASSEPTLYAVSAVSQLDDDFAVTSRITEIKDIADGLTIDDTTSFTSIDYEATEMAGLVAEEEEDDLDPAIAARRDQFLADAKTDVIGDDEDDEDVDSADNTSSVTNINSDDQANANTAASRVAVDSDGGIYVVGTAEGSLGQQINTASEQDVFLTKFDSEGNVVFSRLLGVADSADAYDIKVDSQDNVIIAGATKNALSEDDVINSESDAFVVKISKRGDEVFRYQLDTFGRTAAYSIAIDSNDDIYVGGSTSSAISSVSGFAGGDDALILKLDGSNGDLTDSTVFGTSGNDAIKGLALDANDDLIVAVEGTADEATVYRISGSDLTNQTASVSLGFLGSGGGIESIAIDTDNNKVYVAGLTTNSNLDASGTAVVNETANGGLEGFVSGFSFSGTSSLEADFTTYVSTAGTDRVADLTVNDGKVYVAGSTSSTLDGETARGATDGFIVRLDGASGELENTQQFGESLAKSQVGGLAFTEKGDSVLEKLGLPTGLVGGDQTLDIETQTTARAGDHFYISLDGGRRQRIELEEGDTFDDIGRKLRVAGFAKLDVEVSGTSEGDKLTISTLDDGGSIDLIPGKEGQDLLSRLGLTAGKLLSKNDVFDLNQEEVAPEDDLGGVYAFGLDGALNIEDKANARYVLGLLDAAVSTTQRAFRSLTFNPEVQALLDAGKTNGPVPARISSQIANFQAGLDRLQSGSTDPTVSLYA